MIRLAGRHRHSLVGRVLMAPGGWLQTITTQPPDDDQIEVAVAALHATLAAEASVASPPGHVAGVGAGAGS